MGSMADAFMRGYGFVDSVARQGKEDAYREEQRQRQRVLDARQDTLFQQSQDEYKKGLAERDGLREGVRQLAAALVQKDAPPEVLSNAERKLAPVFDDPLSAAKSIESFRNITAGLDAGKMPDSGTVASFLNSTLRPELEARAKKSGNASMEISGVYPTQDYRGLYFEATMTRPDGTTYQAPLTVGATSVTGKDSGKDTVQPFPVADILKHSSGAVAAQMKALQYIAENGGAPGAEFAMKFLMEKDKAKRDLIIKEWEHARDRAEKTADDTTAHTRKLAEIKATEEAKGDKFSSFGSDETGFFVLNTKTGETKSASSGMGAAAGNRIDLGGGLTISRKEARSSLVDLGNMLANQKSGSGIALIEGLDIKGGDLDSMSEADKPVFLQKIVEISSGKVQAAPEVQSAATNYLKIARGLGYIAPAPTSAPAGQPQQPQPGKETSASADSSTITNSILVDAARRKAERENAGQGGGPGMASVANASPAVPTPAHGAAVSPPQARPPQQGLASVLSDPSSVTGDMGPIGGQSVVAKENKDSDLVKIVRASKDGLKQAATAIVESAKQNDPASLASMAADDYKRIMAKFDLRGLKESERIALEKEIRAQLKNSSGTRQTVAREMSAIRKN
jgi:hypothetical protein